ncbi:hypothetical protein E0Z10_g1475 [Xylaria hypoxylon]|uniref:Uncharacterized protein n=1 Tax=Xylaria hypoxylon TaxID=37992 RepID=A0A4Z0Z729_9PEZI|nr:hypothetical protein E0Z10_g1475 [Xylaria hypoxylon]
MKLFKSASNAGRSRPGQQPPRSNIRGKISGPIPIPDDEFPMRNPGSSIAQEGIPEELDPVTVTVTRRDSTAASTHTALHATRDEKTSSLAQSGPSQASTASNPIRRRTNRSSTLRYSTVSDVTDRASPSRKKSPFRVAISKLFGKRNRKQGSRSASDSEAQVGPSSDHHLSDPVVGERDSTIPESEPKRSASLPITEFNKALRSHSIGPDDFMAIHSARNSLQSDSAFLRRRAATTSGGPISSRLRDEGIDILGLTPRPVSAQGHDMVNEYDPESIGRAVSVDYLPSRRRSRSLSQLHDVSEEHAVVRKRSDEIRYWRASQNPGPLSSDVSVSHHGDPETTETTETTTDTHEEAAQPIDTPPQPFNFGSIHMMKITQVASLEDRVAALEVHNQKLERLVSRLFDVVPGIDNYSNTLGHPVSIAPTAPPITYAGTSSAVVETSIHHNLPVDAGPLSSGYSISEQSNVSFEDEKTFIGSIHPSTRDAPRPISNVTIRGATSLPSLPRDASGVFTPDHYNTLKALLDAERAARHALEIRVAKLSHIVEMMSRTTGGLNTSPLSGAHTNVSVFEHDDDDDVDDDGPPSASIDDDSDAFKTPREERPFDYGDFGEDVVQDEADDGSRKRAARAISLGQLTLGKPKQHSQQPDAGVDL